MQVLRTYLFTFFHVSVGMGRLTNKQICTHTFTRTHTHFLESNFSKIRYENENEKENEIENVNYILKKEFYWLL